MHTLLFGWTPACSATVWAERKEFIGRAERHHVNIALFAIAMRTYFIAYLLALKYSSTMDTMQQ
jgi:hypothetical protein